MGISEAIAEPNKILGGNYNSVMDWLLMQWGAVMSSLSLQSSCFRDCYYISTEIYSLKSHVVNFCSEISSGQSEERTTFFHV